ncbi:MAG TPA: hypothetical protein VIK35_10975 [Verrucomicrobiae bacterium]
MFVIRHILAFALLLILGLVLALLVISAGRFHYESVTLTFQKPVDVSPNLPASLTNAVLFVKVFEPSDPLATNYASWRGSRSLNFPGGSSGSSVIGTNEKWDEDRLIAINAEGFEMLFTKRWRWAGLGQKIHNETNVILFRYGQITETNTLGRRIVGKFK